ncbi:hypothetical protein [Streptomyces kronopolitis]|uniref:hypothetical protein n=1 Tax=Streptomyces kronopolitis TaxID=1612435 RepID=UPI003D9944EC
MMSVLTRAHQSFLAEHLDDNLNVPDGARSGEPPVPFREPAPDDTSLLTRVLGALDRWTPLDVEALLDDVADALDGVPPPAPDDRLALQRRLHSHLEQLERIAFVHGACERERGVTDLVAQSRTLRVAGLAVSGPTQGELRYAGNVVSGLVDYLVALRLMKGPEASTAHLRLHLGPARSGHPLVKPRRRPPAERHHTSVVRTA